MHQEPPGSRHPTPLSDIRTAYNCRVAFFFRKASVLSLKFKFRGLAQSPPLSHSYHPLAASGSREPWTAPRRASAGSPSPSGAITRRICLSPSLSSSPSSFLSHPLSFLHRESNCAKPRLLRNRARPGHWDADSTEAGRGSGTGPRPSTETKCQGGYVRGAGGARP